MCTISHRFLALVVAVTVQCVAAGTLVAADANPFAEGVRSSAPQSPSEQQQSFQLPPGLEIELVASEPDIAKPMNLAFDARGRLWVSDSYEYPYAAPLNRPGKDAIKVFEDTNHDGSYDKITTFADGLNIPIGLYPYKNGVIAWSIPYISYFEDTDGDGRSDRQTKLYGPLGYERDTHGMNASFTRGYDGWLYVTHGFNNNTTIRGADGSVATMNSGNTYRIRLDGSRVEQFTYGQVNPFGMTLDPLGNLYTSDCHSMPAYLLIRDAYYPSFGKPHDGLGFCPKIMEHSHGSTAIDGVVYYPDNQWPAQYHDNVFIGNVMTSRINRDTLIEAGSGKKAREEPDFISTTDSWFRPVHQQFGPDGSLYIADFYNRIIGHYEVPLDHPGRDRHRGRIWKVSFAGTQGHPAQTQEPFDATALSAAGLVDEMGHPNLVRRQLALNYLLDELGDAGAPLAAQILRGSGSVNWQQRVQALWLLHRLEQLDAPLLSQAAKDPSREVRVHAMHILSETLNWNPTHRTLAEFGLKDIDLNVRRAAADAFTTHADPANVSPLLKALAQTSTKTPHLRHSLRIALRNQLRSPNAYAQFGTLTLNNEDRDRIADVSVAIQSAEAAEFLATSLRQNRTKRNQVPAFAGHIAKYGNASTVDQLPEILRQQLSLNFEQQVELYSTVTAGFAQRGEALSPAIRSWGLEIATQLWEQVKDPSSTWSHRPVAGMPSSPIPWILQQRRSENHDGRSSFLSSLSPGGESNTGIAQSPQFTIPAKLSFYLAGHDGYPDKSAQGRNHVRLRRADTNEIIAQAAAPRHDTARQVTWDLVAHQGKPGILEITDGDNAGAYAWLAVGGFTPEIIKLPSVSPMHRNQNLVKVAEIVALDPETSLFAELKDWVTTGSLPRGTRASVVRTLSQNNSHPLAAALANTLADRAIPAELAEETIETLFSQDLANHAKSLTERLMTALPAGGQMRFGRELVANRLGAEWLLDLVENGLVPASLINVNGAQNLFQIHGDQFVQRYKKLTQGLSNDAPVSPSQITELARQVSRQPGKAQQGRVLFEQACQICHQLNNRGALVGPQLDGIGNRGTERLLEDILDPNRNVDAAFHTQSLQLRNGDVISGLFRREEGNLIVLVNAAGQEFTVNKNSVTNRTTHRRSLMPDNFHEILEPSQLNDLVTFLLGNGE